MTTSSVNVPVEFIKLARQMREAQKAGLHSQKEWRRAQNLCQLFDAKLEAVEKVIAATEKPAEEVPPKLL